MNGTILETLGTYKVQIIVADNASSRYKYLEFAVVSSDLANYKMIQGMDWVAGTQSVCDWVKAAWTFSRTEVDNAIIILTLRSPPPLPAPTERTKSEPTLKDLLHWYSSTSTSTVMLIRYRPLSL